MRPTGLEKPNPSGVSKPRNGLVVASVVDLEELDKLMVDLRAAAAVDDAEKEVAPRISWWI